MISDRPISSRALSTVLDQCRKAFFLVGLLTVITELLSLAPILYMLSMFDRVLSSRSLVTLVSLTAIVIAVYIFWSALEWIRTRLMIRISMRIDWDSSSKVFDAAFRRHLERKQINVHQAMNDIVLVRQFLTGGGVLAVASAPFAIFFIIVGGLFHPYLAVFSVVATVMMTLAAYFTSRASSKPLAEASEAQNEASRLAAQGIQMTETAIALGMLPAIRKRWYEKHRLFLSKHAGASESAGLVHGFSDFMTKAFPSLQMALAIYLATEGLITGGMVIAASFLISKAIAPIQKLIGSWKEVISARESYHRLDKLLTEDQQWEDAMELPKPKGKLVVSELFAKAPNADKLSLSNINFTLSPGEALAIIGPSGSGKSTLSRLLTGVWRQASGSVRLDGAEIADWVHSGAGEFIGYVPQETHFFDATVGENIARLGEVDPARVVVAAKLADVHETILSFPDGYNTRISDSGAGFGLTGGQRQKIAIARAFYGLPVFIVMDEANANLDEASELALAKAIYGLTQTGRTIIFSTHRPALIRASTKLLVLNNGKQIAFGPTAEVIAAGQMESQAGGNPVAPGHAADPHAEVALAH